MHAVRTYQWQCIECKSCSLCGTSENDVRAFNTHYLLHHRCVLQTWGECVFCNSVCVVCHRISSCSVTTVIEDITCTASNLLWLSRLKVKPVWINNNSMILYQVKTNKVKNLICKGPLCLRAFIPGGTPSNRLSKSNINRFHRSDQVWLLIGQNQSLKPH